MQRKYKIKNGLLIEVLRQQLNQLFLVLVLSSFVVEVKANNIEIRNPVVQKLPEFIPNTAIYLEIFNHSGHGDSLVSARLLNSQNRTPLAEKCVLFYSHVDSGMWYSNPSGAVYINNNQRLTLKPGHYYILVHGLRQPIYENETYLLELKFSKNNTLFVDIPVKRLENTSYLLNTPSQLLNNEPDSKEATMTKRNQDENLPDLQITSPRFRPMLPNSKNTAVYLNVLNNTRQIIYLLGAESELAEKAILSNSVLLLESAKASATIQPVDRIKILPGKRVKLEKGQQHIKLVNLKKKLQPNDEIPITLFFSNGQHIKLMVPMAKADASLAK